MSRSPSITFEDIENDLKANKKPTQKVIAMAIARETKYNPQGFQNAEKLFDYLMNDIEEREKKYGYYNNYDIHAFQSSVMNLLHYAPTSEKALEWFNRILEGYDKSSLVTIKLEVILFCNLLYVLNKNNRFEEALEIVKAALEIGVFHVTDYGNQEPLYFNDPLRVFENEALKVMQHFNLEYNDDKTGVRTKNN